MIKLYLFLFFLSLKFASYGQMSRDYFFDESLSINDTTSLVLIIEDPQTQFARELNHRIFDDTSFIRRLKEEWFAEYPTGQARERHMCGFDLRFYQLAGTQLTFLNQLNSNCGISDVGCENLQILLESGKPLHVDTLTRIRMNTYKRDLFTKDFFKGYVIGGNYNWYNCRTDKFPVIYYDGYVETTIQLDTNYTANENAERFVRRYTSDLNDVNWNIVSSDSYGEEADKMIKFEFEKIPCEVKILVFMKKVKFDAFKSFSIVPIKFTIQRGSELILMYRD